MSILDSIESGFQPRPHCVVVYGQPGIGKSTFAAGAPKPLFIDCDNRTSHLDVSRVKPTSWADVLDVFRAACKPGFAFGTLVLDTLDHCEILVHKHVCEQGGANDIIEAFGGYGKGYNAAQAEWKRLSAGIDAVRASGINVILLAHTHIRPFANPSGESWDRWVLKVHPRASAFLQERVDAVGFAGFDDFGRVAKDIKKTVKGVTTGQRMLQFVHSPAYESKPMAAYPEKCALDWNSFVNNNKEIK